MAFLPGRGQLLGSHHCSSRSTLASGLQLPSLKGTQGPRFSVRVGEGCRGKVVGSPPGSHLHWRGERRLQPCRYSRRALPPPKVCPCLRHSAPLPELFPRAILRLRCREHACGQAARTCAREATAGSLRLHQGRAKDSQIVHEVSNKLDAVKWQRHRWITRPTVLQEAWEQEERRTRSTGTRQHTWSGLSAGAGLHAQGAVNAHACGQPA